MPNNKYWNILSVKYRHQVRQLSEELRVTPNFSGIAVAIIVKSGRAAVLSSTPTVTLNAIKSGFSRSEILLDYDYLKTPRFISPKEFEDIDLAQKSLKKILNEHQVYRGYCYVRSCEDCRVVVAYNTTIEVISHKDLFLKTKSVVIPFAVKFIDKMLSAFLTELPELKHSRFVTDAIYRHRILTSEAPALIPETLTDKEIAILYWAAKGKSASDTSAILNLSKNTIDSYRRDIIEKLHVTNITQAVHVAIQANLIV